MVSIAVVGSGNLAWHLIKMLQAAHIPVDWHVYRSEKNASFFQLEHIIASTSNPEVLTNAGLSHIFLATSDSAFKTLTTEIQNPNALWVHLSGGSSIQALKCPRRAVFYIPQTFTLGRPLTYTNLPVFIEAESPADFQTLWDIAQKLQLKPSALNSEARKHLHIAAVITNNFVNYLFREAETWLENHQIEPESLYPLIRETAEKAIELGPKNAQTGPANRGDLGTVKRHIKAIKVARLRKVYRLFSTHIFQLRERKL